jgi:MoxR-like ATPase
MNSDLQPLYDNLTSNLLGSERSAELLITGLLAEGHVLIQGAPGLGKTTLAKILAQSLDCEFRRIQFTPDLLPADILGYTIYDQSESAFVFHRGPVFSHIILADEINRASPRIQSALLESMNESQVSVDGVTYELEKPFCVIATQNHLNSAGTFPLPEPQLDRFLLSFNMDFPDADTQVDVLAYHADGRSEASISPVMSRETLTSLIRMVKEMYISRDIMSYIVSLCEATRDHPELLTGASPRASIALMNAARANACFHGHSGVYPDDVKRVMPYVFRHRLSGRSSSIDHSQQVENLLCEILDETPVPVGPA